MTEFKSGIYNTIRNIIGHSSATLAIIYTLGHIIIAMTCNYLITGASLDLAAVDAIVEPCINGVWFYFLHNAYAKIKKENY